MQLVRYVQQKVKPYPKIYDILLWIYSLYGEIKFFFHALFTGKLFVKYDKSLLSEFLSKQKILTYLLQENNFKTVDDFRQWLGRNAIQYIEGGWTFYIPPQEGLYRYFKFLSTNYPPDSGLKILKDFRSPDKAIYTNHKQHPAPGAALKRFLTPSPVSLLRVANYLYAHSLGMKVYDLIRLKGEDKCLTCYVVQHVEGPDVQPKDYDWFMKRLKSLLEQGEITTIHEKIGIMFDFNPPNCSNNLIMSCKDRRPLYVDFQGFLLRDEEKILSKIVDEVKDKVHFGGVRFYRGGQKYLYQSIPGLAVGKRDIETRWQFLLEMMVECQCSFEDRTVYDIGCNAGLMLYNALSEGAQWGIGWDLPDVVESAKRVLLALGATRFNLFGEMISGDTVFKSRVPDRYKAKKNGILFFLAVSDHIGFPSGVGELPWEYMFYEGHANQSYEMSLERLRSVPWLKDADIVSHRCFADGDTPERVVILLKCQA